MTRPPARKSSLSGASPIGPPAPAAVAPVEQEAPAKKAPAKQAATKKAEPAQKVQKPKVSFYTEHEEVDRARGAYRATGAREGHLSWSEFLNAAVQAETKRLEAKYNGGKPFEPVSAGGIPTGRPMGE